MYFMDGGNGCRSPPRKEADMITVKNLANNTEKKFRTPAAVVRHVTAQGKAYKKAGGYYSYRIIDDAAGTWEKYCA